MSVSSFTILLLEMVSKSHKVKTPKEYQRGRTDKIVAERFKAATMSDTKWIRLLNGLTEIEGLVQNCAVKLVWDDEIRHFQIDGMQFNFDYWPHAMEAMISGAPRGWYEYKEIEWIEFDSENNDLDKIRSQIDSIGEFDLERNKTGLRLSAYR